MLGALLGMGAKLRLALWLGSKAVPNKKDLKPYVGKAVFGIIAIIACGVFAAAGVVLAMLAIYAYTMGIMSAHQPALFFSSASMLLISILGYLIAKRAILHALDVPHKKASKLSQIGDTLDETVDAFLAGFMAEPTKQAAKQTAPPSDANDDNDDKVVPIIQAHATAREILHHHPKTKMTY